MRQARADTARSKVNTSATGRLHIGVGKKSNSSRVSESRERRQLLFFVESQSYYLYTASAMTEDKTAPENSGVRYQCDQPLAGDLIFCRGATKSSAWNVLGQRIARRAGTFTYSHVALQIFGFFFHSLPSEGVHTYSTLALLSEQRDWRVYRHKLRDAPEAHANADAACQLLIRRAQYLIGQRYNKQILIPKSRNQKDDTAFCSELVCKVFGMEVLGIGRKQAASVLPIDIYRLVGNSDDWVDVTKIYENNIKRASANGILGGWIESEQFTAHVFEQMAIVSARFAAAQIDAEVIAQATEALDDYLMSVVGKPPHERFSNGGSTMRRLESLHWTLAQSSAESHEMLKSIRQLIRETTLKGDHRVT